jgi:hypothetical protein
MKIVMRKRENYLFAIPSRAVSTQPIPWQQMHSEGPRQGNHSPPAHQWLVPLQAGQCEFNPFPRSMRGLNRGEQHTIGSIQQTNTGTGTHGRTRASCCRRGTIRHGPRIVGSDAIPTGESPEQGREIKRVRTHGRGRVTYSHLRKERQGREKKIS